MKILYFENNYLHFKEIFAKIERIIKAADKKYHEESEAFVEKVFTAGEDAESGKLVRSLLRKIRSKKYYVPELDLIMDENGEVIGLSLFSRFHLEGRHEDELLILTPVAVKTELQRQHISRGSLSSTVLNTQRNLGTRRRSLKEIL